MFSRCPALTTGELMSAPPVTISPDATAGRRIDVTVRNGIVTLTKKRQGRPP